MEPLVILGAVSSALSLSYALYKHVKFENLQNEYSILQDRNGRYVNDLHQRSERICDLMGEVVELKSKLRDRNDLISKLQNGLDSIYDVPQSVFTTEQIERIESEPPRVKTVVEQRTSNISTKSSVNSGSRRGSYADYVPTESYSFSDSSPSYSDCSSSSSCDSGSCCSD